LEELMVGSQGKSFVEVSWFQLEEKEVMKSWSEKGEFECFWTLLDFTYGRTVLEMGSHGDWDIVFVFLANCPIFSPSKQRDKATGEEGRVTGDGHSLFMRYGSLQLRSDDEFAFRLWLSLRSMGI
jgi:hypothetical protein